jgi:hypothetical protein
MPDPNDTNDDIRAKYKDRLALLQEVLGENEAGARNKSMDLAMIGLAIMSGQSPNALTNIGQGAAAGMQAMSARDEAGRERQRLIRTSALEGVLDEEAADAAAQADLAGREFSRETQLQVADLRNAGDDDSLYNDPYRTYAQAADAARARASDNTVPPSDMLEGETIEGYVDRAGREAVARSQETFGGGRDATIQGRVDAAQGNPAELEAIKQQLIKNNVDPSQFGLN